MEKMLKPFKFMCMLFLSKCA